MNRSTAKNLNDINAKFYSEFAGDFSGSRNRPWEGWKRLMRCIGTDNLSMSNGLKLLDVGCGNGRFGQFAGNILTDYSVDYFGIDNCGELLQIADRNLSQIFTTRFINLDITREDIDVDFKFSLIVAFGIMHHIPGVSRRKYLINMLAELLDKNAVLAVAFWRFMDHDRYASKVLSIDDYNRRSFSYLDPDELDDGDVLLKWGHDGEGLRYCHHTSEEEIEELFLDLPLLRVDSFMADGKNNNQNRYVIYRSTK